MNDAQKLRNTLAQFTGADEMHRHSLVRGMLYTPGVMHFADEAGNGAHWFVDIVATEFMPLLSEEDFLVITLDVQGSAAMITVDDGNGNDLRTKAIEFTDCPEGEWKFYLTNNTLLLPSEY